ncbi:MAG: aldehyde dehydrogenase family protein [Acidobacteria bacterium]|nr:aldehyde dehydrogenase family protein [Acidobacteriota bacterium]MCW5966928.1 aldehyde dehydrogenase family protein [Blastocatellales bacterium]
MAQRIQQQQRSSIEICSPSTLEKIGEAPVYTPDEVRAAVERGRKAATVWSGMRFAERRRILLDARQRLLDRSEEVIRLICNEAGKPRFEAVTMEVAYCVDALTFYAKQARRFLQPQRVSPHLLKTKKVTVRYVPRGVVGIIAPWNFPLVMTLGEAVPALAAGNAVIIKPSEWTPLTALLGAEILRETFKAHGLPEDLLQVVTGYGETGGALVDEADMIAFTGSVRTGKLIAERAARRLVPVSLELGGKDPMIVLKDADLERASSAAVWGAFMNSGQVCISVERVYVEDAVAEDFTRRVVEKTLALRQGRDVDAQDDASRVDVGAMTFPKQIETVEQHVRDAVARGAKVLAGGRRAPDLPGRYYEPTVLADVDHSMQIMQDETFGPVLPIMRVRNEQEALQLANDSRYGLNASVWTGDRSRGEDLAARVEAGSVCVNDVITGVAVTDAPFGGVKESGSGRRHGAPGIRRFTTEQVIVSDRFGLKREMIWYPYTAKGEKLMRRVLASIFSSGLGRKLRAMFG